MRPFVKGCEKFVKNLWICMKQMSTFFFFKSVYIWPYSPLLLWPLWNIIFMKKEVSLTRYFKTSPLHPSPIHPHKVLSLPSSSSIATSWGDYFIFISVHKGSLVLLCISLIGINCIIMCTGTNFCKCPMSSVFPRPWKSISKFLVWRKSVREPRKQVWEVMGRVQPARGLNG